ncbi:MAG: sigma 54-dependent Fis family transcriptional regulator [Myxococcales bacterium]|nr:sigma 54-interacting transcriptional regulator [Myxococcota bacterium]MDW8280629.1 sigma 54-dependent Fis family transcriptional regulator [Myxococcales bacterium]
MEDPRDLRTEAQIGGFSTVVDLPRIRLTVTEGPDQGATCDSDDEMLVRVGTRPNNNLVLTDRNVSGYHLDVSRTRAGWRVRDVGSTNGTFVAGMRVFDLIARSGTVISIGRSKIRLDALDDDPIRASLHPAGRFGDMVGQSVVMRRMFSRIASVAATNTTVLITGETGTGKEAVAEAIVQASPRASAPFVVIDCSALPANLIESELFGHTKGSFTGAQSDYRGAFERADGGTVFLDEIGELPIDLQPKLLRVLERREVRRVGSEKTRPIDVRVIAATNRDLAQEVNERRFRQDLYYRLSVVNIHVPPLRERREDIPLLVEHFYNLLSDGRHGPSLAEIRQRLCDNDYTWPGNVRELRNAVERALHVPDEDPMETQAEPRPQRSPSAAAVQVGTVSYAVDLSVPFKVAKQQLIDAFEKQYLSALLKATRHNVSEAARRAQIDRMHLHKLITQHRLNQAE